MANVTITIPDAMVPRVLTALRAPFDDPGLIMTEGENPLTGKTDAQAMKWLVSNLVKEELRKYETRQAHIEASKKVDVDSSGIA
jgi:hypothetical protein